MQKHLARMGFTSLYNTDPDFALKAKMIITIAFVPLVICAKLINILMLMRPNCRKNLEIYSVGLKILMLIVGTDEKMEEDSSISS